MKEWHVLYQVLILCWGKQKRKKEFFHLVTEIGKAYALCAASQQARKIDVEISYFKAVKAGMAKGLPKEKPEKREAGWTMK